ELVFDSFGQRRGRSVLDAPLLAIRVVPLRAERGEARRLAVVLGFAEERLARREGDGARIAEHADGELATLDELLDERVAPDLLVHERRALDRFGLRLRERRLADAVRRLLCDGLHERGKAETMEAAQRVGLRRNDEARDAHAMEGEELLRERLVFAEEQRL